MFVYNVYTTSVIFSEFFFLTCSAMFFIYSVPKAVYLYMYKALKMKKKYTFHPLS